MFLISFCWGNSVLPLGDGAVANLQLGRQLHLGQPQRLAVGADGAPNLFCVHICGAGAAAPALLSLFTDFIVAERTNFCNRRAVEVVHAPWNCNFFGFIPRFSFTPSRVRVILVTERQRWQNGTALLR